MGQVHLLLNPKYKLKNISSRVMGLIGNDVEFDDEYMSHVSS
jgi:hypothetical protein